MMPYICTLHSFSQGYVEVLMPFGKSTPITLQFHMMEQAYTSLKLDYAAGLHSGCVTQFDSSLLGGSHDSMTTSNRSSLIFSISNPGKQEIYNQTRASSRSTSSVGVPAKSTNH